MWPRWHPSETLEALAMSPALRDVRISNVLSKQDMQRLIAERSGLSANNAKSISNAIDYKNAANVRDKLARAIRWLRGMVGDKDYAIMAKPPGVSRGPNNSFFMKVKSDIWLMHKVIDGIKRWPAAFTTNTPDSMMQAYKAGARAFVLMDDASYSGTYLNDSILPFIMFLKSHKWTSEHPAPHMYVAAAYASPLAINKIADLASIAPKHVHVYFPGSMKITADYIKGLPNNVRQRVSKFILAGPHDAHTTLAMMAHKVPNFLSFPKELGYALNKSLKPPYKQLLVNIPLLKESTRNGKKVLHKYANEQTRVFRNNRGRLREIKPSWLRRFLTQ